MNGNAVAQVTADQTLGTQVTSNGKIFEITGGTTVNDTNLFHSFSSFSVPNGVLQFFKMLPVLPISFHESLVEHPLIFKD
jgi:hypothetical protein